jgi:hypothetical protein
MGNIDELFAPPQSQQDPKNAAKMSELMLKAQTLAQKEGDSQRKAQLDYLSEQLKLMAEGAQLQATRETNMSRERIEGAKLAQKRLELAQTVAVHPLAAPVAQTWPGIPPAANQRII